MNAPLKCICPGSKVPFYCPVHGRVENPNWPGLKLRRSVERQEQQVKPPSLEPPPPPNDHSIVAVNDNNGDERQGSLAQG